MIAQDRVSTREKSSKMLDDFEKALSEIITNSRMSDLKTPSCSNDVSTVYHENAELNAGDGNEVLAPSKQFSWSPAACVIRDEIASLAGCEYSTISAQSSIFSLGLDSIDVVKLSSRLRNHLINLSVSMIMRNPSIERLVDELDKGSKTIKNESTEISLANIREQLFNHLQINDIVVDDLEDILPPTPLQEAIVADMLATKPFRYLNQEILSLDSSISVSRLKSAWNTVIDHSPILRTSFIPIDDHKIPFSFAQIIHQAGKPRIRNVETGLRETDIVIQEAKNNDRAAALDGVPFMLTFVHAKDDIYLVLSISHALYDGWSLNLLHNDIVEAYHDTFSSRTSYKDTVEHILNANNTEASQYWENYLSGAQCCPFPSVSKTNQSPSQIHRLEQSSNISVASIGTFIKQESVTLQALGQVCWALVLASYLESLDVIFGVVLSGRDTEESCQMLFPTMNTIAVRSIIHGSTKQMLQDMQEGCIYATQYQHFPLRKAQAAAKGNGRRLFDSLFILQMKPPSSKTPEKIYKSIGGEASVEVGI